MNERFLQYYEDELRHVRETAEDFGALHPLVAGQLRLRKDGCDDPFVERLLEGFAFLSARVHQKLDEEHSVFTQSLLESVYPALLCPTPSMGIVELGASESIAGSLTIPAGTELTAMLGEGATRRCLFRTAHEVDIFPIELVSEGLEGVRYYDQDISSLYLPKENMATAAMRLRLDVINSDVNFEDLDELDELTFFIKGDLAGAGKIYEELLSQSIELSVGELSAGKKPKYNTYKLDGDDVSIEATGFDAEQALLPSDARVFEGHRLLREYSTMPQRFLFVKIKGLRKAFMQITSNSASIVIGFKRSSLEMSKLVSPNSMALNVTPVINLFERRADPIAVSRDEHEYYIHVDKTKSLDYEIYTVDEVVGFSAGSDYKNEFQPFYRDQVYNRNNHSFYSILRKPRALSFSERRNGAVSKYLGTDILLSVVDGNHAPVSADVDALSLKVTCSNRHLPLSMTLKGAETDLVPAGDSGLSSARWILPPTSPTESLTETNGSWNLVNHLSLNYLSLVESEQGQATGLKDLLRIYFSKQSEEGSEWIRGIANVTSKSIVERCREPGPVTYKRGVLVDITFDEYCYGGASVFLFGSVLARFLSQHISINSFIKTNINSSSRGRLIQWDGERGSKPTA